MGQAASRWPEASAIGLLGDAGVNTVPGKHSPCFADSDQPSEPAVVPGLGADTARHYRGMDLRLQRLGRQSLMNVEGTRDDNHDGETSNA